MFAKRIQSMVLLKFTKARELVAAIERDMKFEFARAEALRRRASSREPSRGNRLG